MASGGGVERHVEELAVRLAERGHRVFVYARSSSTTRGLKIYRGVHIIRLPFVPGKNVATITHIFLSTIHVLFQSRVDIIHYHGIGPGTLAWLPRLFKPRAKIVTTFHSRDRMDPKWSWFAKMYLLFGEWTALVFPHATLVVSHILQVFYREFYGRATIYIPNGAEIVTKAGTDILEKFGLDKGKYLLGVGRLVPNKAFDVVIEAYRKVDSSMPFVIAGDSEYAGLYVEKLMRLAGRDSRIHLLGHQSSAAVSELLAHCYAFVHPSRSEGLSTAVLEAMAHGKTVIMSDIQENLELVDHSGIAFPVDNRRALRETLSWVVQDPGMLKNRGRRARQMIARRYTWKSVVKRIEAVYSHLHASS